VTQRDPPFYGEEAISAVTNFSMAVFQSFPVRVMINAAWQPLGAFVHDVVDSFTIRPHADGWAHPSWSRCEQNLPSWSAGKPSAFKAQKHVK
jgi:hypothetical protein